MEIKELQQMYAKLPQVAALADKLGDHSLSTLQLDGLVASSAPLAFAATALRTARTMLFILKDADEAGYFYHDLTQVMGQEDVLYFPSSYRRAVKYGQRDAASEILRTEALTVNEERSLNEERRTKNEELAAASGNEERRTKNEELAAASGNEERRTKNEELAAASGNEERKMKNEELAAASVNEERKMKNEELAAAMKGDDPEACTSLKGGSTAVANSSFFVLHSSFTEAAATSSLFTLRSSLYIVSYPEAVAELVVSRRRLDSCTLELTVEQTVDVAEVMATLREFGFREVEYVYEPGQFALRGSILDVYSYSCEYPFRIDFFGDDIDSIRTFEVDTQLSRERRTTVRIVPELAGLTEDRVPLFSFLSDDTIVVMKDGADIRDAIARTYEDGFSQQAVVERMEGATEVEQHAIMQQMRKEVQLMTVGQFADAIAPLRIVEIGHRPFRTADAIIRFNISPQPLFHKNFDMLRQSLEDYRLRGYGIFILADSRKQNERLKEILGSEEGRVKNEELAGAVVNEERRTKNEELAGAVVNEERKMKNEELAGAMKGDDPEACTSLKGGSTASANSSFFTLHSSLTKAAANSSFFILHSSFIPVDKTLHEGFVDNDMRVCFFTDHQIFDRFHKYNLKSDRARSGKMSLTLKEIRQFEPGDYVVHVDHGIGRFGGLVRMPQPDGGTQEMIKIQYQNGDSIYVSIHSLYKVSKYKAQDNGEPPRLSHLGTGQWERLKERTKKKLKDIARDLIKLYAQRRQEKGFAFSPDSFMQHELEASFLYEDTPDQLKATNDVKADMERRRPMDRLVCGDVGFGKTEVAVRAAFKAACDSKQVAVLVPTTVLAYQHYQTFSKRLKDFPVRVDYLTRARSAKQTKELLKDLEDGKIDILIGTHKLIGKSVKFHDLGLLIIDEEQKFGVAVKEKLRQMKVNVDTLTMSATPIPRTLQFSLVGARDLSTIQTPPPNRYPIQTEIHTFNPEIIADAVNFEMSRNGQVYIVNNRINELQRIADMIHKYIPDARIAIGHGQMKPEELEHIVLDFANYDYDVLVSTTIVESGIDIPNANTIIINGANNFGLSDLHQMRGRVGRGNRKAFCYLLAPPLSALPQESRRRLEALENFSELGSGINIAMQDLDIRGAGNLLGAEQSGFIADLGYETYQKILNQAVAELKNDEFADLYADETAAQEMAASDFVDDCALESDIEMYFPPTYIPNDSERMLLYRELDNLTEDAEVEQYRLRLRDRFGAIPAVGEELMRVVPLRRMGKSLGCEKIMLKQHRMTLFFVSNPNSPYYRSAAFDSILSYIASHPRRCNLREHNGKRSIVISDVKTVGAGVDVLREIMENK